MTNQRIYPPILNDLPSAEDKLGFEPYVRTLSDIILDPGTQTPLTLGLFGSWGSGKTSLMRQMQRMVENKNQPDGALRFRTVWFNAWKYNQEQTLWRALMLVLLDDLERLVQDMSQSQTKDGKSASKSSPKKPKTKEGLSTPEPSPGKLLSLLREALYRETSWSETGERSINWTQAATSGAAVALNTALSFLGPALAVAGMATDVLQEARKEFGKGASVSQIGKLAESFRREEIVHYQAQLRSLEQFQKNFALLVSTLLQSEDQTASRLVVFVDDLDRCLPERAIPVLEALKLFLDVEGCVFVLAMDREAIESAIRRRYQGEVKARDYLEKIVQVPFVLPPIEAEPMRAYVQSLAPALPDPRCAEVFAVGLGSNPRQVKRILNVFLLLSRLREESPELQGAIQPVRLAKIVSIQHVYRDLYDLIQREPDYLCDLDAYFRETSRGDQAGEISEVKTALPDDLAPFANMQDLERLFLSVDAEDAVFAGLKQDDLKPYITLTRRAAPPEESTPSVTQASVEPEMVLVLAGEFPMGTDDSQVKTLVERYDWAKTPKQKDRFEQEQPVRPVPIDEFEIGRYPVLNGEYAEFVRVTDAPPPSHWPGGKLPDELADHPVVNVSWHDALAYVQWLTERTGKRYRLPSEAEWEKAASWDATTKHKRIWPWGDEWNPTLLNWRSTGPRRTTPRGQYSPDGDSPHGCADMVGNVWEWCSNLWGSDLGKPLPYPYDADDGREDLTKSEYRIVRGGSWYNDDPAVLRCASRGRNDPGLKGPSVGFRVARSLPK